MKLKFKNTWFFKKTGLILGYYRSKDYAKKSLLPAVFYSNTMHPELKPANVPGFVFEIGIWDCYVRIGWVNVRKIKQS